MGSSIPFVISLFPLFIISMVQIQFLYPGCIFNCLYWSLQFVFIFYKPIDVLKCTSGDQSFLVILYICSFQWTFKIFSPLIKVFIQLLISLPSFVMVSVMNFMILSNIVSILRQSKFPRSYHRTCFEQIFEDIQFFS